VENTWDAILVELDPAAFRAFSVGPVLASPRLLIPKLRGKSVQTGDSVRVEIFGSRLQVHVCVLSAYGQGNVVGPNTEVVFVPALPDDLKLGASPAHSNYAFESILKHSGDLGGGAIVAVYGVHASGKSSLVCRSCASLGVYVVRVTAEELLKRSPNSDVRPGFSLFRETAVQIQQICGKVLLLIEDIECLDINRSFVQSLVLSIREASQTDGILVCYTAESLVKVPQRLTSYTDHFVHLQGPSSRESRRELIREHLSPVEFPVDGESVDRIADAATGLLPGDIVSALRNKDDPCTSLQRVRAASQQRMPSGLIYLRPSDMSQNSEVFGLAEALESIEEVLLWPQQREPALAQIGLEIPQRILLFGPSGSGKTTLARRAAKKSGYGVLCLDVASLVRAEVGVSEANLEEAFSLANALQPCLLFIDEIEALFEIRDSGSSMSKLVATFAAALERWDVPVLAATNRPWDIDPALIRVGRFDKTLYVPLPDFRARRQIFQRICSLLPLHVADGVRLDRWASFTEGFSGADLFGIARTAVLQNCSKHRNASGTVAVSVDDFDATVNMCSPSVSAAEIGRLKVWSP